MLPREHVWTVRTVLMYCQVELCSPCFSNADLDLVFALGLPWQMLEHVVNLTGHSWQSQPCQFHRTTFHPTCLISGHGQDEAYPIRQNADKTLSWSSIMTPWRFHENTFPGPLKSGSLIISYQRLNPRLQVKEFVGWGSPRQNCDDVICVCVSQWHIPSMEFTWKQMTAP